MRLTSWRSAFPFPGGQPEWKYAKQGCLRASGGVMGLDEKLRDNLLFLKQTSLRASQKKMKLVLAQRFHSF